MSQTDNDNSEGQPYVITEPLVITQRTTDSHSFVAKKQFYCEGNGRFNRLRVKETLTVDGEVKLSREVVKRLKNVVTTRYVDQTLGDFKTKIEDLIDKKRNQPE